MDTWRFDVIVDANILRSYMTFRQMTCRGLAARVGCSHSAIGHYRTGRRKTCDPALAHKIAKALDMPLEPLFLPELSRVSQDIRQRKSA